MGCHCRPGYTCISCAFYAGNYGASCNDPRCCPGPEWRDVNGARLDMQAAMEARLEKERIEKERKAKKYQEHIASLEKIRGACRMFRTWRLYADGTLRAMTQDHTWVPGENVTLASGYNASKDSGFYGFSSLEELQRQEADWWQKSQSGIPKKELGWLQPDYWYVCGTMLAYGHCKFSEKGGRVQKAIPEYIIEPEGSDPDFGMLVLNAAEKYGMQIMTVKDAEEINTGFIPWAKPDN